MTIAVSLIMPVYNAEKHLSESIESALSQTNIDIELICVDDGSTDSSPQILEAYAAADPRLKVINQQNKGAGEARNAGIELACGEYIGFLDSDDLYSSDSYLSTLYANAKESNQRVSSACFLYYFDDKKKVNPSGDPYYAGYAFDKDGLVSYQDFQFDYGFHRYLFARSIFDRGQNRFSNLSYYEDPIWLTKILSQEKTFYAVASQAYLYRCDHKPISWTTKKVLDLLEGVRQNLVLSKEHNLPKLHWYTVRHLDESTHYTGVGVIEGFDVEAISSKLSQLEGEIDRDLLAAVDPADRSYMPALRRQLNDYENRGRFARKFSSAAFIAKRNLAPLYHRLKG